MTAKTSGSPPKLLPGPRSSHAYSELILSGQKVYNGGLVGRDPATGQWITATSTSTALMYGFARLGDVDNADNTGGLYVNDLDVDSETALMVFASAAISDEGQICYVVDDQTCTLTPGGPIAGIVIQNLDSTHAYVMVDPWINKVLSLTYLGGSETSKKARLVVTSLSASYTGSGTGTLTGPASTAWPTQDGITNGNQAVGDVVFIQEGTVNLADPKDAGPWTIVNLAASSGAWVLTRPAWWLNGGPIVPGVTVEVGPDGTGTNPTLAGTTWKSFAPKSKIIGTDAPVFWPRTVSCGVTLASGTLASPRTTIPVRSHLITGFLISSDPTTAPHASTKVWRVSALTVGVTGASSVQIVAESAPGTTNTSDVGQYNIVAINW